MKKAYIYLAVLGFSASVLSSASYAQNSQKVLQKTIELYSKATSMQSELQINTEQVMSGKEHKETIYVSGSFQKPLSFRSEIRSNAQKIAAVIVCDGKLLSVFDCKKNTYFQVKPTAQAGPQAPGTGNPAQTAMMLKMLFPTDTKVSSSGSNYVLTSTKSSSMNNAKQSMTATAAIDKASGQLRSLSIVNTGNNGKGTSMKLVQSFTIRSQKINTKIAPGVFHFTAPKGVKKVEAPKMGGAGTMPQKPTK